MIKVTRVEVIERGVGRHYTNYEVNGAEVHFQDGGRTIKVFINEQSNLDNNEEDNNIQ